MIRVRVEGVGIAGPGLNGWPALRQVLAGGEPYVAAPIVARAPPLLPAAEGRRTGVPVKLALAVAHEAFTHAGRDPATTATVFTSSSGDGDNVHQILEILASESREVSPTRFHNSVHNAAAGYWSIAARSREPSTSLCGYDASFAVGLIDAATQVAADGKAVALIAYDHPYPEPLHSKRPLSGSFAVALILAPDDDAPALATLEVAISRGNAVSTMADANLEGLRSGVPAARALPLLAALGGGSHQTITIDYVAGAQLSVEVTPCS